MHQRSTHVMERGSLPLNHCVNENRIINGDLLADTMCVDEPKWDKRVASSASFNVPLECYHGGLRLIMSRLESFTSNEEEGVESRWRSTRRETHLCFTEMVSKMEHCLSENFSDIKKMLKKFTFICDYLSSWRKSLEINELKQVKWDNKTHTLKIMLFKKKKYI